MADETEETTGDVTGTEPVDHVVPEAATTQHHAARGRAGRDRSR